MNLSRLLLSLAFGLALSVSASAASPSAPWPDNPVTITDANTVFDEADFRGFDAVWRLQPGELMAPRFTLASMERTPEFNPHGSVIAGIGPAPFDAIADWRARVRVVA